MMMIKLTFACLLLVVAAVLVSARPGPADAGLQRRLHASQELTIDSIRELTDKELREHLTWRGDTCEDCDTREKMLRVLHDHVMAGTGCSIRTYTETSAALRKRRQKAGLGDNPFGNNPQRRRQSREKRNRDHNDPMAGLKDILSAHGLAAHTFTGQKDMSDFLEKSKKEKKSTHGRGNPDL